MSITQQQLLQILPNAGPVAGVFVPLLNAAMGHCQIVGTKRAAAWFWATSVVILVPLYSYCRFGADPRLAYGILENCETAVLKLVKSAADMRLLRVLIFPGGLETLPVADTELLEASAGYKTLVEREQGKFIYPAVKVAFKASNTEGALQNEEVTCQYGGVQYKDGAVLSMRLMYVDLGPISIKNPLVYKEDGFQGWVKQGIEEWVELHDMTPTTHWKHFLDRSIKVLEWEGTD